MPEASAPNQATPATPSLAYTAMQAHWQLPRTLMGGTLAMRAAEQNYLPREPKEDLTAYSNRLQRSVLFNGFRRTVRSLSGQPFRKPTTLTDSATEFEEMATDIDLGGTDLTTFGRQLEDDLLVYGKAHFLVDYPDTAGKALTLHDERTLKIRPYFARVCPSDLIAWTGKREGGIETLDEVRIKESTVEKDGEWGEREVKRIRVLRPTEITLYREAEGKWIVDGEPRALTLGRIPLVTIYATRQGLLVAYPPLEDLAWLNLRHWQADSDYSNIVHVAQVPILFGAGLEAKEDKAIAVGPNTMFRASSHEAKLTFVEIRGQGPKAGADYIQKLEDRMQVMGLDLMVKRPSGQTATAVASDDEDQICDLQAQARSLEAGLEAGFALAGEWLRKPSLKANVNVFQDFGISAQSAAQVDQLLKARMAGEITRATFLAELQRRGLLSDQVDLEDEAAGLETEDAFDEDPALGGKPANDNRGRAGKAA